jgi:hypothetical protein
MRHLAPVLLAPILLALAAPVAAASPDIPLIAIGLPFAPEAPSPVAQGHPLFQRVAFTEIQNLPGSTRFSVARPSTIHGGLRDTLKRMNMLAGDEASAKARLIATWVSVEPSSPFVARKFATATIAYRLVRIDTGEVIFDRTIRTTIQQVGAHIDWSMGGRRAAVAANFASAALCLDKASFGTAPRDCALKPLYQVRAERR